VRERQALTLAHAIKRITSEPADFFGMRMRGRLKAGLAADVAIFDPNTVSSGLRGTMRNDLPGGRKAPGDGSARHVLHDREWTGAISRRQAHWRTAWHSPSLRRLLSAVSWCRRSARVTSSYAERSS